MCPPGDSRRSVCRAIGVCVCVFVFVFVRACVRACVCVSYHCGFINLTDELEHVGFSGSAVGGNQK